MSMQNFRGSKLESFGLERSVEFEKAHSKLVKEANC